MADNYYLMMKKEIEQITFDQYIKNSETKRFSFEEHFEFNEKVESTIEFVIEKYYEFSGLDLHVYLKNILKDCTEDSNNNYIEDYKESRISEYVMYQKIAIKDKIYDYCKDRITDLLLLRAIYKVDSIQRIISSSPDGFSIDPVGLLSIPTEHEFDLPNYNTYDKEGNIKKKQHLDEMDSFFVDKLVDLDFSKIVKFLDYQYDNTGVEKKKFLEHIKRTEITISKPLIKYEKVRIALLNWIDKKSKQGYNETSKKEQKQIQNENVEWHDKVLDELIENKIQEKLKTQVIQNSHSPKEEEPFLTRKEVSKLLNISLVTLDKWQKAGKIKFHRFESRVRFKWSEIQDKQK